MGRETEGRQKRRKHELRKKEKVGWGEMKMSGLYREAPLGEGQPSPWTGKLRG